jgi:hypothetical protein
MEDSHPAATVHRAPKPPIYGVMAEFKTPMELLEAVERASAEGYRRIEAYTPMPVEGLADALGYKTTRVPLVTLVGGILGGLGGYAMQYWIAAVDYPQNVGGRPLNSWPAFIPVTFELTILGAALAAVLGMLALNGLPMPYHPVFHVPRFALATRDRFFLCIESRDQRFDRVGTRRFLESLDPREVCDVPY